MFSGPAAPLNSQAGNISITMTCKLLMLIVVTLPLSLACQPAAPTAPPAIIARPLASADRVIGMLSLREGVLIPPGTLIEIIVEWGNRDEPLAIHSLTGTKTWPATFEIPIQWPDHKGHPVGLRVYARGASGGRQTFIALPTYYRAENLLEHRPLHLTLIPAME